MLAFVLNLNHDLCQVISVFLIKGWLQKFLLLQKILLESATHFRKQGPLSSQWNSFCCENSFQNYTNILTKTGLPAPEWTIACELPSIDHRVTSRFLSNMPLTAWAHFCFILKVCFVSVLHDVPSSIFFSGSLLICMKIVMFSPTDRNKWHKF